MASTPSQAAFIDALDRHRGILFKVANAYCRDAASREDLVQDTIVQLWRAYHTFDGRRAFSTWMYRIAVNVAISFHRRERRKTSHFALAENTFWEEIPAPQEPHDERMELLREIIDRLDELDRALMILYLDDRPYAEIADILGISETNVATKIGRLKQHLRRTVAAQGQR
jgi:RNA polymerase sigma factor (sigma-70 family)